MSPSSFNEGALTLGGDPELIFVDESGLVSASTYFPSQGSNHNGNNPEIGGDGHPHIVELRPKASSSPRELTNNHRDILKRAATKIPANIAWMAGSWIERKPIGGHVHFGGVTGYDTGPLVEMCDGILAQQIILCEDENGARRRRAGQYGKLSNIRTKLWGFEYRTLPSFILSPHITIGVFALAKAAMLEELNNGDHSLKKLKKGVLKNILKIDKTKFVNADKAYFRERMDVVWKSVIRNYQYFKTDEGVGLWRHVASLKQIADNHPSWHNDKDIMHRWNIRKQTPSSYKVGKPLAPLLPVNDKVYSPDEAYSLIFHNVQEMY
jgi:hypothetical protein